MDIYATLNEITTLSIEDRIVLVQAIWDSIAAEQAYPDLTEAQKHELDRRIDSHDSDPDNLLTWDEIKAFIRKQGWSMYLYFAQKFVMTSTIHMIGTKANNLV